jgi:hypothetical protein
MVDRGRARDVNDAAARFAETLADSYRLVYGQTAESAERQHQRAQEFSELVVRNLREQTEAGRANAQQFSEQAARQQETGQALARESVEAYAGFLDDAFSRYRSGTERAAQSTQEGARAVADTAASLVGTAAGAAGATVGATAGAMRSVAETRAFPIEGYDEINVDEISKRLNDLSVEELRLVRDHEERNKARESLLEQMDRKIRAS